MQARIQENAALQFNSNTTPSMLLRERSNGFATLPLHSSRRTGAATGGQHDYLQPDSALLHQRRSSESAADLFAADDAAHALVTIGSATANGHLATRPRSLADDDDSPGTGHAYINVGLQQQTPAPPASASARLHFYFPPPAATSVQRKHSAASSAATAEPGTVRACNSGNSLLMPQTAPPYVNLNKMVDQKLTLAESAGYHRTVSCGRVSPMLDYVQLVMSEKKNTSPCSSPGGILPTSPTKKVPPSPTKNGCSSSHRPVVDIKSNYARIDYAKTKAIKDTARIPAPNRRIKNDSGNHNH